MKIGLTQRVLTHNHREYDSTDHGWYNYLQGHDIYYIPNTINQDFEKIASSIDMLIISGGGDHPVRNNVETTLVELLNQRTPIIGICHGCHFLTEYLGGEVGEITGHQNTEHYVQYRDRVIKVNSFHSCFVRHTPPGSVNLCVSEDGICESWIKDNIAGITWHPERMQYPWVPDEIANLFK